MARTSSSREQRQRLRTFQARQTVRDEKLRRRTRDNVIAVIALVLVAGAGGFAQYAYLTWGPGYEAAQAEELLVDPATNPGDVTDPSTLDEETLKELLEQSGIDPETVTVPPTDEPVVDDTETGEPAP